MPFTDVSPQVVLPCETTINATSSRATANMVAVESQASVFDLVSNKILLLRERDLLGDTRRYETPMRLDVILLMATWAYQLM